MKRTFIILALGLAGTAASAALTKIGVAAAVSGGVKAFTPLQKKAVGRVVSSGQTLFLNDEIKTDGKGRLQIMLLDETIFTLGPNSAMVLDEFVYDPNGSGKLTARITKGFFRFITGRVARKDPANMKVRFPSGTMGIRGTIVAGQVMPDGDTLAVLLGPGAGNNAGERAGAFILENAGTEVTVDRPGFGSHVESGLPPSPPAEIPAGQLAAILGQLGAPPSESERGRREGDLGDKGAQRRGSDEEGDGRRDRTADRSGEPDRGEKGERGHRGPEGGRPPEGFEPGSAPPPPMDGERYGEFDPNFNPDQTATELAGQDVYFAEGDLTETRTISDLNQDLNGETFIAGNDSAESSILDSPSKWEEVRTIPGGKGVYKLTGSRFVLDRCGGGACSTSQTGSFDLTLNVDFGAKTIGGNCGGACANSSFSLSASDPATEVSISETGTFAAMNFAGLAGPAALSATSANGKAGANVFLHNANGKIAADAQVNVHYSDTAAQTSGFGAERAHFALCGSTNCAP